MAGPAVPVVSKNCKIVKSESKYDIKPKPFEILFTSARSRITRLMMFRKDWELMSQSFSSLHSSKGKLETSTPPEYDKHHWLILLQGDEITSLIFYTENQIQR